MAKKIELIDVTRPWAMHEPRARQLLATAIQAEQGVDAAPADDRQVMDTPGGTRIIKILGAMICHDEDQPISSCLVTYHWIFRQIEMGLADGRVQDILLLLDSPGGDMLGLVELCDYIAEKRQEKPIYAHVMGTGASAAYWLAASALSISAARVSYVGSIGCIAITYDDRRALESVGVDRIVFVSSVSPNKHADTQTDEGRALIQSHVDRAGKIFVDAVGRMRSQSAEYVLANFGAGDILLAEDALKVGMIDRIGSLRETVRWIEEQRSTMIQATQVIEDGKDEVKPDESEEEVEESAQEGEPEEEETEESAEMDEDEDEEMPMTDKAKALAKSSPLLFSEISKIGARVERNRIKSLVAVADLYPYNRKLFSKALLDPKMDGGSYLEQALRASKKAGNAHVEKLNADGDLPRVNSDAVVNRAEALDRRAAEHMAKIAGGKNGK